LTDDCKQTHFFLNADTSVLVVILHVVNIMEGQKQKGSMVLLNKRCSNLSFTTQFSPLCL